MQFAQVGEFASSKSAMKTFAPELSALMIILRSTGPVISTRRSQQVARDRRDRPVALADLARLRQEVRQLAGVEPRLARFPRRQQLLAPRIELLVQRATKPNASSDRISSHSGLNFGPDVDVGCYDFELSHAVKIMSTRPARVNRQQGRSQLARQCL